MSALSDHEIRERLISYTCQRNCCGIAEQSGICCTLGEKDWILGPIDDTEAVLERLEKRYGRPISFAEVFIEYEEGRLMFPDKSSWQNAAHYPAMRVVADAKALNSCAFLKNGMCSIHEIKPKLCASFVCEYVQELVNSVVGS